jgi:hypothetical protein
MRDVHPPSWRIGVVAISTLAGCSIPMALHAPTCAPRPASADPAKVDLAPIALGPSAAIQLGDGSWAAPGPDAIVTSGMRTELDGRALRGGETGGYAVSCTLDRFSIRRDSSMAESHVFATLYVDLACTASRAQDHAVVWRGELRGRAAATGGSLFENDMVTLQHLVDRMVSDASREMASDLALRALGLTADPGQRVFADDETERELGGTDDTTIGAGALTESAAAVPALLAQLGSTAPGSAAVDVTARASVWNSVAMSVGPGDAWNAGDKLRLDDEPFVRFYQYKALARLASPAALAQLGGARDHEDASLLSELLADSLSTGGIGFPRSRRPTNASAVTNGTTTRP